MMRPTKSVPIGMLPPERIRTTVEGLHALSKGEGTKEKEYITFTFSPVDLLRRQEEARIRKIELSKEKESNLESEPKLEESKAAKEEWKEELIDDMPQWRTRSAW